MNDMESLEEIDKLCQNINFDEDICDGFTRKINHQRRFHPKRQNQFYFLSVPMKRNHQLKNHQGNVV